MDPSTLKFRHALPYAIFPASPTLAALHASRARSLHSDHLPKDPLSCSRCGSFIPLHHPTTYVNNKRSNRVYRRSCRMCGAAEDSLLPKPAFPPTRKHRTITTLPLPQTIASSEPPPKPHLPALQSTATSKSRPKNKSGLQQLLARNRQNEEKERQKQKQADSQFSGLAAFLSDLH